MKASFEAQRMPLYFDSIYTDGISPDARFPRSRYVLLAERLSKPPFNAVINIKSPDRISIEDLKRTHCPNYVDRFIAGRLSKQEMRRIGLRPWTDAIIDRTLYLTGGAACALTDAVSSGGIAGNMAGGTHHAHYDFGSGYCIFNDLAVCAKKAQQDLGLERILIIDLDVHQGDGTAAMLSSDPKIFTLSIHCGKNFPFRKAKSDLDIELPAGLADNAYMEALIPALRQCAFFQPDVLFFQAGVDPLGADKLGKMNLTREGLRRRNALVFQLKSQLDIPCVVFMGGGYADPIEPTIEAFVDLFHQAALVHCQSHANRS